MKKTEAQGGKQPVQGLTAVALKWIESNPAEPPGREARQFGKFLSDLGKVALPP